MICKDIPQPCLQQTWCSPRPNQEDFAPEPNQTSKFQYQQFAELYTANIYYSDCAEDFH